MRPRLSSSLNLAWSFDLCAEHTWLMLGSSDFVDKETTQEIPHIFSCAKVDVFDAVMSTEDRQWQSCEIGRLVES